MSDEVTKQVAAESPLVKEGNGSVPGAEMRERVMKMEREASGEKEEEAFVDLVIEDDRVVLCGKEILRKFYEPPPTKETWRSQWEFIKKKLAARGSIKDGVKSFTGGRTLFKKMVDRG